MEDRYFVYILTNRHHTVLYTGVTGDLVRRTFQHREKATSSFTSRYNVDIAREKQIKGGSRGRKIALIDGMNPAWRDLFEDIL